MAVMFPLVLLLVFTFSATDSSNNTDWRIAPNVYQTITPKAIDHHNSSINKVKYLLLIVDDMHTGSKICDDFINLDYRLVYSFLPMKDQQAVNKAKSRGHDIMLHLPLQGSIAKHNDNQTIYVRDPNFKQKLVKHLGSITSYSAINNHTGSVFTSNYNAVDKLFSHLIANGRPLFIDSLTTNNSKIAMVAKKYNYPVLQRDIFLDHDRDVKSITRQLEILEKILRDKGSAIAIAHPRRETLIVLKQWLPTLKEKNIFLASVNDWLIKYDTLKK